MTFASKEEYEKHIEAIKNVTSFIDYFSNENELFGSWQTDSSSFPHINYSQKVDDFLEALDANRFITVFDWTLWDYGKEIYKDHTLIASLDFTDLKYLLTLIVRKERFCEGVLLNAIDNGMILSILMRLDTLCDKQENSLEMEEIDNSKLIELNEFYITGMGYYDAKEIDFSKVRFLSLRLEPNNEYDTNAIEVYHQSTKVGYVPKEENALIAKMMKQDVKIIAQIIEYNPNSALDKKIKVRLYQNGMIEVLTLSDLYKKHIEVFGVEPYVIGMFWSDQEAIINGISEALENGVPYNEYLMLSVEERIAFDKGLLLF